MNHPPRRRKRIGLIGFGFIGRGVYRRLLADPALELAFVHNRSGPALADVPAALRLADLAQAANYDADLVVEVAHTRSRANTARCCCGIRITCRCRSRRWRTTHCASDCWRRHRCTAPGCWFPTAH